MFNSLLSRLQSDCTITEEKVEKEFVTLEDADQKDLCAVGDCIKLDGQAGNEIGLCYFSVTEGAFVRERCIREDGGQFECKEVAESPPCRYVYAAPLAHHPE